MNWKYISITLVSSPQSTQVNCRILVWIQIIFEMILFYVKYTCRIYLKKKGAFENSMQMTGKTIKLMNELKLFWFQILNLNTKCWFNSYEMWKDFVVFWVFRIFWQFDIFWWFENLLDVIRGFVFDFSFMKCLIWFFRKFHLGFVQYFVSN